ncbi:hypothetical protein [Ferrovibrio sp.]|uniref:hypothetical protein n=1 Tax=Ferrovibrio sp. TaxID=1917215 RepID=UPI001B5CC4F4|nr:hypothetical protein [Ferrovibrio sp.]MBP7066469.1 hypothetical protein [Ferrovibrio sp.]
MANDQDSKLPDSAGQIYSLDERRGRSGAGGYGGGAGNDGGLPPGLDARVAKLEADTKEIKDMLTRMEPVLAKINVDIAEIKGRVSAMPTTWQLIGLVIGVFAAALAFVKALTI